MTILGNITIILGALIFATATLGLIRFPDAYTRISAVGTAGGLGIILITTGALLLQPTVPNTAKFALIIPLQLATSAIGSTALARAAHLARAPLHSQYNDLEPCDPNPT
ncbi:MULTISPECIES: cation:proton antiporter [Dietzia]|uniref:Monovalent cation/H(+) antiporter subunit G n=2 Tax=Dietzia TaxID=37914 RepID=A0ABT8GXP7_9ACTN|nr:monovalent cation/H(+) antiporter subunit G [Dietzia maris]MDN4504991.1 monovalent cation/H(+) antiporter subunit G [Dietzia maris]